jgi:hypothetical protein
MKKNRMMRVASVLLVAVLLTTSAISGTFAKYVTSAAVADSARVAKWGVTVTASGSLFEYRYSNDGDIEKDENNNDIGYTVVCSSTSQDVVAPGTKNETGLTFTIEGSPEVAVNIDFNITEIKDVVLPANSDPGYLDFTTGNDTTDYFTLADDYYPIVYTLTKSGEASPVASGHMSDIVNYFNNVEGNYTANTNLSSVFGTYNLTWAWAFGDSANNSADTFLGQMVANNIAVTNASTEAGVSIAITVAQVD